jgi:uncharacterized protein (DUF4415 family)
MLTRYPILKEFEEGRGYSREDWDAVDSPELTDEELASMRPLKEVLPELYAAILREEERQEREKQGRGKQIAPTKVRIALRIDEDIVTSFKATGKGWQSKMNEALRRVTPSLETVSP